MEKLSGDDIGSVGGLAISAAYNEKDSFQNKDFFVKKRLHEECSNSIPTQMIESVDPNEFIYVMEWYEYCVNKKQPSQILACGISHVDGLAKYKNIDCELGLYVFSHSILSLSCVAAVSGYTIRVFDKLGTFRVNNFTVFDIMYADDPSKYEKGAVLCKILTSTISEAEHLHKILRNQYIDRIKDYAALPFYWNIDRFVMFEMFVRNTICESDTLYTKSVKVWIDNLMRIRNNRLVLNESTSYTSITNNLNNEYVYAYREEESVYGKLDDDVDIPIITFDIETSSNDDLRLPTGEVAADELVSVAIYHEHNKIMYSLAYLPIDPKNFTKKLHERRVGKSYKVVSEFFFKEQEMLIRCMENEA